MTIIRKHFDCFLDYCAKNELFNAFLGSYYQMAIGSLAFVLKRHNFEQIIKVYLRHSDWILGASDIDLVVITKSSDSAADIVFLKRLWKVYFFLKGLFPMLCGAEEIRFIPVEQFEKHPLRANSEALLLLSPHKWKCIYSKDTDDAPLSFSITCSVKPALPLTRFLHFNLYGYMQRTILSGEDISELKFRRLSKNMMKILQHLFYLKERRILDINELATRLSGPEETAKDAEESAVRGIFKHLEKVPVDASGRYDSLLCAFRKLILLVDNTHNHYYDLRTGAYPAPHTPENAWMEKSLRAFIGQGDKLFGGRFRFSVIKPICELTKRAFLFIDEDIDQALFKKLIGLSTRHNQKLSQSGTRLYIVTDKILTSQFYTLWSPYALEAHILLARESFNPRGLLKIKLPPDEWTLWKIRNSVSIFEEYYLPFMTSPYAKGKRMDFCRIYERPEVEMLFHYFYYLKDRDVYLEDLKQTKGDSNEILCLTASKYADELGLSQWHPYEYVTAYPYIKKMIRLVDRMACEKIRQGH